MVRPKSDMMDERNAPLRSHPPDKPPTQGITDEDDSCSASIPPRGSLFQSEQRGRSQERNQQRNRSLSLFKRRDHSELPPIQTSSLAGFIPKSSTGPLDNSDMDFSEERPFLPKLSAISPFHSNEATIPRKEKQGDGQTQYDDSQDVKDEEEYNKFRASLNNSLEDDSPIDPEDEREKSDSMIAEQKDQVRLFRSSLLAGIKAQEDRRGRSRRTPTPPDHPQIGPNAASEAETHDSTVSESKDCVVDLKEKDDLSLPETLKPIASFQEESEESLDCLIDELEAEDGKEPDVDAITIQAGEICQCPPELLETKVDEGLNDAEVAVRRKKYGWNRMKEQKRNHFIKFISFFNGPVQWVMEVSKTIHH